MRFDRKRAFYGLLIAGVAGGFLLLPAISFVGTLLQPTSLSPTSTRAPRLLADAIWARAMGGRATELQSLNPVSVGRTVACHIAAEINETGPELEKQHDECFGLLPGIQAAGYLANVHMRSQGIWQDPRVPFVAIANVTKISGSWSRDDLVNTVADRGSFGANVVGTEHAARVYFAKPAAALNAAEAAFLAAILGDWQFGTRGLDPWCDPTSAAAMRQRVLERMRDNGAIDEAAFDSANRAALGLAPPPADHEPCDR